MTGTTLVARSRRAKTGAARIVAASLMLVAASVSPGLHAQGLGIFSGGSDPLDGEIAERAPVLETLDSSFVREQLVRLERAKANAGDEFVPFDAEDHLDRAREDYLAEAEKRLFELQGDGSLTLGEIATELPSVRDEHIRRFEDVVEARSLGYAPPPEREAFDSAAAFAAEMTGYITSTRNPPDAWGRIALYAGAGVLIALALSWLLKRLSSGVSDREHHALASALDSLRPPLVLAAAAIGLLVGLDELWLPAGVERFVRTTLQIVVIGLAFLACWNLGDEIAGIVARTIGRATGHDSSDHLRRLIQRALRVLVIVAFLLVVSRVVLGISLTGLLTGLGIVGVGLWFLTRGLVENVAASFTLFGDRVFRIGDTVIHGGEWGVIEDIGFRSTRCRTFDGHLLHIPNRNLIDDTIRNVSSRPYIRRRFRISILYDTPPAKIEEAMEIVRAVIEEQGERVDRDEGVHVVLDGFGAYDLQLLVQFYTASDDYWTGKAVIGDVNVGIRRRFEEAGIGFAFPTQTTVLESDADAPPAIDVGGSLGRSSRDEDGEASEADEGSGGEGGRPARDDGRHEADRGGRVAGGSGKGTRRDGFDEASQAEDDGDGANAAR